ncbi:hypothetical protein GGI08_002945 [Coemansia sp. S2]|nr:hypothetical protein GGI08_002945 [Coemansia sp. S2]
MTDHISPAQRLPTNVVSLILKWMINEITMRHSIMGIIKDDMTELMYVCQTWHQAALEYMWRELSLTINEEDKTIFVNNPKSSKLFKLPVNAEYLVREIRISVSMCSIINGTAYKLLAEYMGDTPPSLPLARKLFIMIVDYPIEEFLTRDNAITEAQRFVQLLQSISQMPTLTTEIKYNGDVRRFTEVVEDAYAVLVNSLCHNAKCSKLDLNKLGYFRERMIEHLPAITSLVLHSERASRLHSSLLYKCALSLTNLHITTIDANMIFLDLEGNSVVYPNLQCLQIHNDYIEVEDSVSLPEAVPFPKLKSLGVYSVFPFTDDAIFQADSNSLEYLNIYVDYETVTMLNNSRRFQNIAKHLKKVVIQKEEDIDDNGLSDVPKTIMDKFIAKLAGSAHYLGLLATPVATSFIDVATVQHHNFENTRILDVRHTPLSLFKVLQLLKALPSLSKLFCGNGYLGSELDCMPSIELPDYVANTYGNSGKCLYELRIKYIRYLSDMISAEYVMLLALASPKVCLLGATEATALAHQTEMTRMLRRGPFSKYASQLQRLIE